MRFWLRQLHQRWISPGPFRRPILHQKRIFWPQLEILDDRITPATFAWTGSGGGGLFSNANNWNDALTGLTSTPGAGDRLIFPLNGPSPPGTVTNDLTAGTAFNSITFLSAGWTINGNTIGITSAIHDTTNIAGTNTINAPLSFAAATSSVGINVVNPSGTATNLLAVTGTVDLANVGFTFSGFGNLTFNNTAVLSNSTGTGGIVANGPGTLTLSAADTYTGGTTINGGNLIAQGNATVLGTGAVTVNDGGTLQIGVNLITNPLNLNGDGFGGNGAMLFPSGGIYSGNIVLQTSSSINIANSGTILRSPTISGPGGLTVVGTPTTAIGSPSQLTVTGTCSYTGVTNILGSQFILAFSGTMAATSKYVVSQGGYLRVENQAGLVNNRLGIGATVELDGGSLIINANAVPSTESFAALNLGNAAPGVIGSNTVELGTANNTVTVGTLNRFPGSTATFLGTNIGTTNKIQFGAFGAGAALVNGILPFAVVGNGAAPATDFATHGANGIAVGASVAFAGLSNGGQGNGTENLKLTGNAILMGDTFVNSLNLNNFGITLGNFRLIVGSGGLMNAGANTGQILGNGSANSQIVFGTTATPATPPFPANGALTPVEGILTAAGSNPLELTTAPIAVGNNLTINAKPTANTGGVMLDGTPASAGYTGVTWVTSGTLTLNVGGPGNAIPTPLVIGDNAGGQNADQVIVASGSPQDIGTAATPGNVTVNSTGRLLLNGNQSVGNLTLKSGHTAATVFANAPASLTVTGSVTSGGVSLSPATGLTGTLPTVINFKPSQIAGTGGLILAPGGVASGTTTFNVGKTPSSLAANASGSGSVDLLIAAVLNGSSAILDMTGTGVLSLNTLPGGGYTGSIQIDSGTFAPNVVNLPQNIVVNAGGTLGSVHSTTNTLTAGSITVNGGTVNPGLPASALNPANSNADYLNAGTATTPNFSAGGILNLHIAGFGTTADWDQFQGTAGANQVTLGGTSILNIDLLGLAQSGVLTGKFVNGVGASPFIWANPLIGRFSNAPNAASNILPAANVLNNPTGFQVVVSYGAGFITVAIAHPPSVLDSSYTTTAGVPLTVSSRATGVLATLTDPDFTGALSNSLTDTVLNPGSNIGSAGGTLVVNANGTFTYTPPVGFVGTESFSTLQAVDLLGVTSAPFTATFTVRGTGGGGGGGTPAKLTGITSTTPTGKYNEGGTINVTVNFDQPVTLSGGNLIVNLNDGATVTLAPFSNASSFSGTYTVAAGQNTQSLDSTGLVLSGGTLKDGGGNNVALTIPQSHSLANANNFLIDTILPTVSISLPSASTATTGPITYTILYGDTNFNTNTLTAANVTLNKTGTANGTVTVSGGPGLSKTVTISNITGAGTLGISLAAGTASDTAGNLAPAAGPSTTFNVANIEPELAAFAVGGSNGSVRLVSKAGTVLQTVSPISGYTGLVSVALGEFNGDTVPDLAVAAANPAGVSGLTTSQAGKVFVYDGAALATGTLTLIRSFTPFTNHDGPDGGNGVYTNGLNIAVGNVGGDSHDDIVAGTRGGNGGTSGQVEFGRLVVIDGASPVGSNTIIGGIQTPFGKGYTKGVIVAAGNVDGVGGDEVAVTRGGPVNSKNASIQQIKVKVLQLKGAALTELPLAADGSTAFSPFAGLSGAAKAINRDGRVSFVDSNGDGKDELVFTASDPLTNPANGQVRVGVYAIDVHASKGAASIVSTGPDAGTYVTGKAVVDHAITHVAATGLLQNIAIITETASSGIVYLAPLTGVVQTGGFSLNILNGGVTIAGI
ncbi:MAG: autotransporter-associated beta strand repeat-containing protein [Planctomycetes bacterium]|nr:autotransporter-associated beta strand repeat-containing protein [Planctomycetota bacterium]